MALRPPIVRPSVLLESANPKTGVDKGVVGDRPPRVEAGVYVLYSSNDCDGNCIIELGCRSRTRPSLGSVGSSRGEGRSAAAPCSRHRMSTATLSVRRSSRAIERPPKPPAVESPQCEKSRSCSSGSFSSESSSRPCTRNCKRLGNALVRLAHATLLPGPTSSAPACADERLGFAFLYVRLLASG